MSAYVLEVDEGGLADANGRVREARLLVNIAVPIRLVPGHPAPVYVIRKAEKKPEQPEERIM